MRITAVAAAFALIASPSSLQAAAESDAVDQLFAEWVTPKSPGCALAASRDGDTLFNRYYGLADAERDVPISEQTTFEAASITKQFTAASVLLLVERGKLSLNDDIRRYLPELKRYPHIITVDNLLTHTSGLRDWEIVEYLAGWNIYEDNWRHYTQSEFLRIMARQNGLNFEPGTRFAYSNSGYMLAAIIAERVSGEPLSAFMRKNLFQPLGMASSELRNDPRVISKNRAIAYRKTPNGQLSVFTPLDNLYGSTGLISSPRDLLTWNRALDTGALGPFVTAELQREALAKDGRRLGYARGLWIARHSGADELWHGGLTGAYQSSLLRFPKQKLSIALQCNAAYAQTGAIAHKLATMFLQTAVQAGASSSARPSIAPVATTGSRIFVAGGAFLSDLTGLTTTLTSQSGKLEWGGLPIEPSGGNRLVLPNGAQLLFRGPGLVEWTARNGEKDVFRRVQGPLPSVTQLRAFTGLYYSEEADASYKGEVISGRLILRLLHGPEFTLKLTPIGRDIFDTDGDIVRFVRDRRGKIISFLFSSRDLKELPFKRQRP